MFSNEYKQQFIPQSPHDDESVESFEEHHYTPTKKSIRHRNTWIVLGGFILSLSLNVFQYLRPHQPATPQQATQYSGLPCDTPVEYHLKTDYWGENQTLADELWNSLESNSVVIAISNDRAKELRLPPSTVFPWDDERSLYGIKVFHDTHCLKNLYRAFKNYERGNVQDIPTEHIDHCLDALRQDIMCKADDSLMPFPAPGQFGGGQMMECRNWDKLIEWAHEPEQNACHNLIDDYKGAPVNVLERFAFCPEGSPYKPVMDAYFEKFGHKQPFGK